MHSVTTRYKQKFPAFNDYKSSAESPCPYWEQIANILSLFSLKTNHLHGTPTLLLLERTLSTHSVLPFYSENRPWAQYLCHFKVRTEHLYSTPAILRCERTVSTEPLSFYKENWASVQYPCPIWLLAHAVSLSFYSKNERSAQNPCPFTVR